MATITQRIERAAASCPTSPVTKYQNNVTNKYTECGVTVEVGKPPRSFCVPLPILER